MVMEVLVLGNWLYHFETSVSMMRTLVMRSASGSGIEKYCYNMLFRRLACRKFFREWQQHLLHRRKKMSWQKERWMAKGSP